MDETLFRILLADDDEVDRLLFKEALEELKIKCMVDTVNNGIELMDYLNKKNTILPQLIFLDLDMPRKNGLECLNEIRNSKTFNTIPVAIYSTSAAEKDIEATFLNGANVYIKKPNDFSVLKQRLSQAVSTAHLYEEPPFKISNFLLLV